VSESHEPSYYEIALTNRQVVVAFVILLVCLIAAFFSGVWVGRENGYRAAEQMARNAPPPEEEKKEGQNLEELEFFGSGQKAEVPRPAPAPAPAPGSSTLAEDVGSTGPAAKPPAAAEDDEEETRPAAQERQAQAAPPQPDKPSRTKPGRETPAPAPAEPKRTAGQVVIQVFSSPEKDQAERIRGQLARGGQRAYLSPVEVAGRTMYRVRIGPFDSRDEAQKVAEKVRKGYKLDTWVTE
jgi:cell division septation protein DedD